MQIHGFTGDSLNSDVMGRQPNELLIETGDGLDLIIDLETAQTSLRDEGTDDVTHEHDEAAAEQTDVESAEETARRTVTLHVSAVNEEIPGLGIRRVRAIAPGVCALELAQIWCPPSPFGEVDWNTTTAPPIRPDDGVYLFTVRASTADATVSCLATARIVDLPLEVQTYGRPPAVEVERAELARALV